MDGALTLSAGSPGERHESTTLAAVRARIVVLLFSGAIVSLRGEWSAPSDSSTRSWVFLVLSGLATGASWLCYYRALQLAPASMVAPIDKLSVVVAIVLGIAVLGEPVSWKLIVVRTPGTSTAWPSSVVVGA